MKNENWLRNLLYEEVLVGEVEKNGKIYQKYKFAPKFKITPLSLFLVSLLFFIIAIIIILAATPASSPPGLPVKGTGTAILEDK